MPLFSSPSQERTILVIACTLFALSAFGLATVDRFYAAGLVGWLLAAWQSVRYHRLATDPDEAVRGQVLDLTLTLLITLLGASLVYSLVVAYGPGSGAGASSARPLTFAEYQVIVFAIFIQTGGWLLAWVQGVRSIRLNQARAAAGNFLSPRRKGK